jgi:hypothetical protein
MADFAALGLHVTLFRDSTRWAKKLIPRDSLPRRYILIDIRRVSHDEWQQVAAGDDSVRSKGAWAGRTYTVIMEACKGWPCSSGTWIPVTRQGIGFGPGKPIWGWVD